jgi:hypothetical protein
VRLKRGAQIGVHLQIRNEKEIVFVSPLGSMSRNAATRGERAMKTMLTVIVMSILFTAVSPTHAGVDSTAYYQNHGNNCNGPSRAC